MLRFKIFSIIALLAGIGSSARANMIDVFGTSSRSQGMANVGVASASDFSAVYYNPSLLAWVPSSISLEFTHGYSDVGVLLMPRPSGYDPKDYNTRLRQRSDNTDLPSLMGITVGFNTNFGTDFLAAGVMAYLPASGVGNLVSMFPDEKAQLFSNQVHMELLGTRLQTQSILFGVAFKPTDWLSVGAGFSYAFNSNAVASVYTPNPVDPSRADIALNVAQDTALAIVAGLSADLGAGFRVGAALREEQGFELRGSNLIQLHGMEGTEDYLVKQPMSMFFHYAPTTINLGLQYKLDDVSIAADGTYLLYNKYKDTMGRNAGFSDSYEVGLGAEFATWGARTRVGVRWAPSPVPAQTGRTNYADNDRIMLATGLGGDVNVLGARMGLDLHLQATLLPPRDNVKSLVSAPESCDTATGSVCDEATDLAGLQTGNPGFPGFTSGGFILTAGITATWYF